MIRSPAKINFGLRISKKRDDGYHPLSTIFLPIDFYDHISIEKTNSDDIRITCTDPAIPTDESNICWKAADSFFRKAGIREGLKIDLQKNIPSGGGLGGGSSNAAAVLKWLNNEYPEKITESGLMDIAAETGADVPFFMIKEPCYAEGIGEILTQVDIPFLRNKSLLLVIPDINVCTADAFAEFDRSAEIKEKIDFREEIANISNPDEAKDIFINDFEGVIFSHHPDLREIKDTLYDTGAEFASMTGSGSVVYGIYSPENNANAALTGIGSRWTVIPANILF
ncbi:MAG: 4-(cytidine 5'-diphospho)-2-C-methyl-D-erythritol kinase [bacterium]|nr:4-(cytidine 5'-diphospho)-2-C-methyl-D-erythritol kinase [bacterium]